MVDQILNKTKLLLLFVAVGGAAAMVACNTMVPSDTTPSLPNELSFAGQETSDHQTEQIAQAPVAQALCGTVTITGGTGICAGSSQTFTANFAGACGNPTHQWTVTSGTCSIVGAADGQSVSVAAGDSQSCEITYQAQCANCDGPATGVQALTIGTVPPSGIDAIGPSANSTSNTACVPNAGAGATYNWTIDGGTITAGQGTSCITYTAGDGANTGGMVKLDVEISAGGCVNSASMDLALQAGPICSVTAIEPFPGSANNTACVPDAGVGATYNWSLSGGTITGGQGTRCITYSANDVSSVTINTSVALGGQTCAQSLVLNTRTELVCAISAPEPFASSTGNSATVTDAGIGATYAWTITGGTITSGQGTSTVHYTAGASGNVDLTVNVSLDGTTCTATRTLAVLPGIEPCSLAAVSPCPNSSGNSACAPDIGAEAIYVWNITGGTITSLATSRCITYSANATGVVKLEVHIVGFLCDCIVTQELPIIAGPSTVISAVSPCPNSTGNTASVPDAGVGADYQWTITGGTITAGQGTKNITYTAAASGIVSLGVTITASTGCSVNGSKNANIVPFPVATISASNPCASSLNNSACVPFAGDGSTYLWNITGGTITSGQGTACITYSAGASGTVGLNALVTSGSGCETTGTKSLTVQASPSVAITATSPCPNSAGNIASVTSAGLGADYQWTLTGGTITSGQGTNTIHYSANASGTVAFSVAVTTINGCLGNAAQSVAITANPTTTITAAAPCAGSTGNTASVPDAGVGATYSWSITGGSITGGLGTRNLTYTAGTGASLILTVTITTANGCSLNGTITNSVNALPVATITAGPACPGSTGNVASVPNAGVGATYNWSIIGGSITSGLGTSNITYSADSGATLSLSVQVARNGCSVGGTQLVTITPPPICTFNPATVPGVLTGTIVGGTAPYTVSANVTGLGWHVLSTQVDNGGVGPGFTLTYSYDHPDMALFGDFHATFTDTNGCVESPCQLTVPCF